jgi:hypothetical protein
VCYLPSHLTVQGRIPLVIETHSAEVIATLIELKREFEAHTGHPLRMTVAGATEAYLLASELAEAGVGVVLTRARPFPKTWERQRMLVCSTWILAPSGSLTTTCS